MYRKTRINYRRLLVKQYKPEESGRASWKSIK
jgi:hypothetical protein